MKVLPAKPYNYFWLDCIYSNLLGVLTNYSDSIYKYPLRFSPYYFCYSPSEAMSKSDFPSYFYDQGWMTLQMNYENKYNGLDKVDLHEWVNYKREDILVNAEDLIEDIKKKINYDRYVFIDSDRFFYDNAAEQNKLHKPHPSFVYGYDDDKKVFFIIDDCVKPGVMECYTLPYDVFINAHNYLVSNEYDVRYFTYGINRTNDIEFSYQLKDLNYDANVMLKELVSNDLELCCEKEELQFYRGLSSVSLYADHVDSIFSRIKDEHIEQFIPLSLPGQSSDGLLRKLQMLINDGFIDLNGVSHVVDKVNVLKEQWDSYKNKLYKYITLRQMMPEMASDYKFDGVSSILREQSVREYGVYNEIKELIVAKQNIEMV